MKRSLSIMLLVAASLWSLRAFSQTVNAQNDLFPVLSGACVYNLPVLANDQFNPVPGVWLEVTVQPVYGNVTFDTLEIDYCSQSGYIGSDQFRYVLHNGVQHDTATVYISVQEANTLVFPGDADQNGQVEHFDALAVGLTFGLQGPPRDSMPFNALAWAPSSYINSNAGAADADGNGLIDVNDVTIIEQMYGSINPFTTWQPRDSSGCQNGASLLSMECLGGDSLMNGDTAIVLIKLENPQLPIHAYGIALTLETDADFISPALMELLADNSWMADSGLILFSRSEGLSERHIAFSRTNHISANGQGEILRARIPIDDNIDGILNPPGWHPLQLRLKYVRLVNEFDVPQDVCVQPLQLAVFQNVNSLQEHNHTVIVRPNPADDFLLVSTTLEFENAAVYDVTGRQLLSVKGGSSLRLDTRLLPDGVYLLKCFSDTASNSQTFLVKH